MNADNHNMRLVIALDMASLEENLALAKTLAKLPRELQKNIWLKIGLRAFIRDGKAGIESIKNASGANIFLDLKLYDIPNTMADAAYECARLGVNMLTIHASAGVAGMRAVMERLENLARDERPLVMGVSALTSFSDEGFSEVYLQGVDSGVRALSALCYRANIDGVVCSVLESSALKANYPTLLALTPGIRPFASASDDQQRVASVAQAYAARSDFIVVGRPIYKADDPCSAIEAILAQISSAQKKAESKNADSAGIAQKGGK